MKNRVKALLVLAFLIVSAAGVVVGMAVDRRSRPEPPHGLDRELDLSPEQQKQMRSIWSDVVKLRDQMFHKRRELDQKREAAIRAMLTPEQVAKLDEIQQGYDRQLNTLEAQVQQAVHAAEQQTRKILTPQQEAKLDQVRKKFGPPFHFHHHSPGTRPSTGQSRMTHAPDPQAGPSSSSSDAPVKP